MGEVLVGKMWFSFLAVLGIAGVSGVSPAQTLSFADWRRELGLRVQSAEAAYLATADADARARAVAPMDLAVRSFFRGDGAEVAWQLEHARLAARGFESAALDHPAARLAPRLQSPVLDGDAHAAFVRIGVVGRGLYAAQADEPAPFRLYWRVQSDRDAFGRAPIHGPVQGLVPFEAPGWNEVEADAFAGFDVVLPSPANEAQLFSLELAFDGGGLGVVRRSEPIERIPRLAVRLDELQGALLSRSWPDEQTLERDTALALVERLRAARAGNSGETRWSAAAALREVERLAAAPLGGPRLAVGVAATGDHWLARGDARARWFVPPGLQADRPAPLVVALHGAGGSENLFFDGHGGGRVLELAAERGWFVLAPRMGLFGGGDLEGWIEELRARWPVDTSAMFLVGHSMGAAAALRELSRSPTRYLAAALLGGGGAVSDLGRLHGVALLIAAGERDFGLPGARALAAALAQSGHPQSTLAVIPHSEHLLVVPLALPAAFALFDGAVAER